MTSSVEPTQGAARIRELINAEDEQFERITAFVEDGVRAGRIAEQNGDALIATARVARDANVRILYNQLSSGPR